MTENKIITIDIDDGSGDRYSRFKIIPWWDQEKLKNTKVIVVGAGALGNEILKNLALLGVGHILIIDVDRIESSNLSRSVLYRKADEGQSKAMVAARVAKEINPDCSVNWLDANVVYEVGLGVFRWADLVFGGLDNREARLSINKACWKANTPWIDGAIEVLFGTVKVFVPPNSACYECTMNEEDFKSLKSRFSCPKVVLDGKVPTTPTIASIVAGLQVQEGLKIIHNLDELATLEGKGLFVDTLNHNSYTIEYTRKETCYSHDTYENIKQLDLSVEETSLQSMLNIIRKTLGQAAYIDLEWELVYALECNLCSKVENILKPLGSLTDSEVKCSECGQQKAFEMTHAINGNEPFITYNLGSVGVPYLDIITGRNGTETVHFELIGDFKKVFGD